MVDWFANVGTVIGSLTDFLHLDLSHTGTARKVRVDVSLLGRRLVSMSKPWEAVNVTAYCDYHERLPGALPSPLLRIYMLDKLSQTRAATSISLLVEIFLRKK